MKKLLLLATLCAAGAVGGQTPMPPNLPAAIVSENNEIKELTQTPTLDIAILQARAQKGDAAAEFVLSQCYEGTIGTLTPDEEKAQEWLKKSAEDGCTTAEVMYGSQFALQNPAEAEKWYRKSIDAGNPSAIMILFYQYDQGIAYLSLGTPIPGFKIDRVEATKWLFKMHNEYMKYLTDKTQRTGMEGQIAERYQFGLGVPQDLVEAQKWYLIDGPDTLAYQRKPLEKQLTAAQMKEAQARADAWKKNPGRLEPSY